MSKAKHTPGPWEYENVSQCSERSGHAVVTDANGKVLFDTLNSDVAEIKVEHDEFGATYSDEQGRVNLTLAAASPDLLTACEAALPAMEKALAVRKQLFGDIPLGIAKTVELLKAAIAKARG